MENAGAADDEEEVIVESCAAEEVDHGPVLYVTPLSIVRRKQSWQSRKRQHDEATTLQTLSSLSPKKAVRFILRQYNALRRNLLKKEHAKRRDGVRVDLQAGKILNSGGFYINRGKKLIGPFPGIHVGDQFFFRMEILCAGLHMAVQSGIEYVKDSHWQVLVAISIIASGGYDDRDDGETLIYNGQGGRGYQGKVTQDQKLERGNLALENSMKFQVPVRVIRGIRDASSPSGTIYTYDGLYSVDMCWSEQGKSGFQEFKFRLQRLPGQPKLGSAILKLANHLKWQPSLQKGLKVVDISRGMENVPVSVVNTVDEDDSPPFFEYSADVLYPVHISELQQPVGCTCEGICSPTKRCLCFSMNGGGTTYLDSGVLVKEQSMVFECGTSCSCSSDCSNRVTQKGLKHRLEIFKIDKKGWGVRSLDPIPAGSFVCQYTGKAIETSAALQSTHNSEYVLNLTKESTKMTRWGDVSSILESKPKDGPEIMRQYDMVVDACEIGNVGRFIKHSCCPNLLAQPVLYDHHDFRFFHIMLFAMDNLPPLREFTLNYSSGEFSTSSDLSTKDCLCEN